MNLLYSIVALLVLNLGVALSQVPASPDDPCGYPDTTLAEYRTAALLNWGYSYDSLKADLARWSWSPYVQIDSVGASVQNRAIYMMTIRGGSTPDQHRKRVWIHARTHPNEVQGTWVTNEMIRILLGESPLGRLLRDSCIINIIPMYNPDGVELGLARQNANGVDLESNWAANPGEPEVRVLRGVFTQLMSLPNPIKVALNMHSAYACKRYFVYHAASGTSQLFATIQQDFIGAVRSHFPGGLEPYNYFVSWTSGAPTYYPESWFWYNHREATLALTYEDKNCTAAGGYDSTAYAILRGAGDHLNITSALTSLAPLAEIPSETELLQNYPNPFNPATTISFRLASREFVTLKLFDLLGREVATLVDGMEEAGVRRIVWDAANVPSGVYFYQLRAGSFMATKKLSVVK